LIRATGRSRQLDPGELLRVGDTLVVTGSHGEIDKVMDGLAPPMASLE
jgi:hypothetical protein